MHLFPGIYQVGGLDCQLTVTDWDSRDCNVYVVDTGEGLVMIDCGCGETLPEIMENMRDLYDLKVTDISHLLLTHAHFNHAEAAHALKANKVQVVVHKDAAEILESGDERTGWYAFHKQFVPVEATQEVEDGDVVEVGEYQFEVLSLPGHAQGHVAYRLIRNRRSITFSGDAIFPDGELGRRFTPDFDPDAYQSSLARLLDEQLDAVLPGHGLVCMKRAHIWVEECYESVMRKE